MSSPIRVAFVSALHPPFDKRVFSKEARTLAYRGLDVIHLAPGEGVSDSMVEGVRVVTYRGPKSILQRLRQLPRLYHLAANLKADIYHCNEVDAWMVGVSLRFFRGTVCIFDVHEHYPEDFAEMRFSKFFQPAVRYLVLGLMWLLSLGTDRIVLAKSSLARDFQNFPDQHIYLVQNFSPLDELPVLDLEKQLASRQRLQLIHLGLINRVRGWPQMLEGLFKAQRHDVDLLVLGEIGNGEEQSFFSEVERLGLIDRVQHRAWLPYAEAVKLVMEADVGVILFQPGYYNHIYALPHKLFDYMGCALPVIAPGFAVEVADIVSGNQCGLLVDAANSQDFADAIDALANDPKERRAMGKRGREAVEHFYNWEAEGRNLAAMYAGLGR